MSQAMPAPLLAPGEWASYGLAAGATPPPVAIGLAETTSMNIEEASPTMQSTEPRAATVWSLHNLSPAPLALPYPDGRAALWLRVDGIAGVYRAPDAAPSGGSSKGLWLLLGGAALLALLAGSRR